MARGSGFGAFGKNFIIVGNAQHRIFGLRFGYLIRATTSFLCALTPVPRVVKEGPRFHFLAPLQGGVLQPQKIISHSKPGGTVMGVTFLGQFRIPHSVSSISLARHVLCASRVAVREEAEETAPDPWSAFTSSITTTLVAPVVGTRTPGDFIIILLPSTWLVAAST
jgi:hypothetical protein